MVEVNIRDKNFGGEPSSCHQGVNKHVKWNFSNKPVSDTCFITDMCLNDICLLYTLTLPTTPYV
mgnify:CR=1 FL=1